MKHIDLRITLIYPNPHHTRGLVSKTLIKISDIPNQTTNFMQSQELWLVAGKESAKCVMYTFLQLRL